MPTKAKSPIRRAKPALRLPTLAAFKKLTIRSRIRWFAKWAATKRGDYDYDEPRACALYQFGRAISSRVIEAGGDDFSIGTGPSIEVLGQEGKVTFAVCTEPYTFAALTKRLNAHLGETA